MTNEIIISHHFNITGYYSEGRRVKVQLVLRDVTRAESDRCCRVGRVPSVSFRAKGVRGQGSFQAWGG